MSNDGARPPSAPLDRDALRQRLTAEYLPRNAGSVPRCRVTRCSAALDFTAEDVA